jgi:3-hydroxyacyl-[acyl-carrier-protein] dehydratase
VTIDYEEIRKLVPQAFPFIMLDRVIELEPEKRIVALKNVSANEIFFLGHFPKEAIMPGAMILEGMGQATIVLFKKSFWQDDDSADALYLFSACKARFLRPVFPGDQLRYEVKLRYATNTAGYAEGVAFVDGDVVSKSELVFGIRRKPAGAASGTVRRDVEVCGNKPTVSSAR